MFGETQENPWMWATDLSGNWFYRKQAKTRMSIPVLIGNAIDAISKNGVVMMNIALRGDGTLPEPQAKMLSAFGNWIKINGNGIYGTRPWKIFGEGPLKIVSKRTGENLMEYSSEDIRFTTKNGDIYAFVLARPTKDVLIKSLQTDGVLDKEIQTIELLGSDEDIIWTRSKEGVKIKCPKKSPNQPVIGFKITLK
jgi:alpha-L-fucosidase